MKFVLYFLVATLSCLLSGFYFLYYPHIQTNAVLNEYNENCEYYLEFPSKEDLTHKGIQRVVINIENCKDNYFNEMDEEMLVTDLTNTALEAYSVKVAPNLRSSYSDLWFFYYQNSNISDITQILEYTIIKAEPNIKKYTTSFTYINYINEQNINNKKSENLNEIFLTLRKRSDVDKFELEIRYDNSSNDVSKLRNGYVKDSLNNSSYKDIK